MLVTCDVRRYGEAALQKGLARQAVNGPGASRHDCADAAFTAARRRYDDVGDLDSLLVDDSGRGARAAVASGGLDADLLVVLAVPLLDAG